MEARFMQLSYFPALVVRQNFTFHVKLSPARSVVPHIDPSPWWCQPALFRRLETDSEFGSPAPLWPKPRRDGSIAAKLLLMAATIGNRASSLPTCSAVGASGPASWLRTPG